jgi:hypothetical protein
MAGRILDRRKLREHAEGGEQESEVNLDTANIAVLPKKNAKMKEPKAPKVKKPRAKKTPPILYAHWGVFDKSMNQVAIFDYNQRAAAEEKVTELNAKAKGDHFLQIVKEPMPELASAFALEIK